MERSGARVLLLILALVLVPARPSAQTVGGAVADAATGQPVSGAVVALVDSLGTRRQAVLSDAQGRYTLQAGSPGTYRVRAERVGYSSASSPALALGAGQHVDQALTIRPRTVMLDAVVARGVPRECTIRPENGEQAAVVWDEARKALDATHLGARGRAYEFRVRLFRHTLAFPRLAITDSSSSIQSGFSRQPFATPGERLVTHGYMEIEGDSIVFRAPDAPTLLSDTFLDHHCFSLRQGRGTEAGLVGLAFAPLRGRRLPDVQGTLWLDGRTGQLRYLEYTYTRLPFANSGARLGGRLDFAQVAGGGWIVNRWSIRMPILERGNPRAQPVVTALVESGGEVLDVRTSRGGQVAVRSVSEGTNAPAAAASSDEIAAPTEAAILLPIPTRPESRAPTVTVELPATRIEAAAPVGPAPSALLRARGYYDRMLRGSGTFWTGDEFRARGQGRISEHIARTRRVDVVYRGRHMTFVQRKTTGRHCPVPVFLNGIRVPSLDVNQLRREDIAGLEVYEGMDVPGEFLVAQHFTRQACGAVVVWTETG
jgi:hypothetical protein